MSFFFFSRWMPEHTRSYKGSWKGERRRWWRRCEGPRCPEIEEAAQPGTPPRGKSPAAWLFLTHHRVEKEADLLSPCPRRPGDAQSGPLSRKEPCSRRARAQVLHITLCFWPESSRFRSTKPRFSPNASDGGLAQPRLFVQRSAYFKHSTTSAATTFCGERGD